MSDVLNIRVHRSHFPGAFTAAVTRSLASRTLAGRLAYEGTRQTLAWLELHRKFSPAATASGMSLYDTAFDAAVPRLGRTCCRLIGLGVGGGWKEARLLDKLVAASAKATYAPMDVSTAMVITACETARLRHPDLPIQPLVADLEDADDIGDLFPSTNEQERRIITCFGMLPGFEPSVLRQRLQSLLKPGDLLLLSANLAATDDAQTGVKAVLPQDDNTTTRHWLLGSVESAGFDKDDGDLRFSVEESPHQPGQWRVVADFVLKRQSTINAGSREFVFAVGDCIRVFQSHRYTMGQAKEFIAGCGFDLLDCWANDSGEEGVFLVRL